MQRDAILLVATKMARDGQFRRPFFDALVALIEARETVVSKDFVRVRKMTRTVFRCGYLLTGKLRFWRRMKTPVSEQLQLRAVATQAATRYGRHFVVV